MKKLSLIALCALLSMLFFVSCGSDDEDAVDTETGDTQSDTDTPDSDADTTDQTDTTDPDADTNDTTDPTNPTDDPTNPTDDPTNPTDDPTNPTDDPTNPTDDPTNPTDDPTNPTDDPTNPTDDPTNPTDPTNPGEGDDNLNTGDTSGNQAQSGKVGAACTSDSQCTQTYGSGDSGQEAFCLTANDSYFPAPGGYCSFMCDATDYQACSNAGGVYHGYNSWGDGYCFHKCTKPSDCRVGYRCSNKIHACLPDCATTGCKTGTCDATDKVCL